MTKKAKKDITTLSDQLDELRQLLNGNLNIPTNAYSTDGKTFVYQAPLSLNLPLGCYVMLKTQDGIEYLAQIITKDVHEKNDTQVNLKLDKEISEALPDGESLTHFTKHIQQQYIGGNGVLIGCFREGILTPPDDQDIFQSADVQRADEQVLTTYFESARAEQIGLEIGKALTVKGHVPIVLRANGFDRHTFLCGQSGSGKTFALGIILEQLLLHTQLKVLIIDPNSDFVCLNQLRTRKGINQTRSQPLTAQAYKHTASQFKELKPHIRVCRPVTFVENSVDALRIRLSDLEQRTQPLVLELDPLADREEFNSFWKIVENLPEEKYSLSEVQAAIASNFTADVRQIGLRIENLGIAQWDLWSPPAAPSVTDILDDDWRCMVVDIGTLSSEVEKSVATMAILDHFWHRRQDKEPVLIVIDEAHTVCPGEPATSLQSITANRVIQMAGEGRKYGLYLLLASQRPWKIHPNALSQCENLILMHMNSNTDLKQLSEILSQVPFSFLNQAPTFRRGDALLVGQMVQNPTFARFEGRLTQEGGCDIPTNWANTGDS